MRKWLQRLAIGAAGACLLVGTAFAYLEYTTAGGQSVGAVVLMWLNGSNQAQPTSAANPLPTTTTPSATTIQGYGTVSTASIALTNAAFTYTNINTGAASAFAVPATWTISNRSGSPNSVYVCLQAGTCNGGESTSNGVEIAPNSTRTFNISGSTVPTVISDGTSYVDLRNAP